MTVDTLAFCGAEDAAVTLHPVHRLRPTPSTANNIICRPRRLFPLRKQSVTASADPGSHGLESWRMAAIVVEVVTVSVDEAIEPDGVTVGEEKMHDAPAGIPEQLSATAPVNPF